MRFWPLLDLQILQEMMFKLLEVDAIKSIGSKTSTESLLSKLISSKNFDLLVNILLYSWMLLIDVVSMEIVCLFTNYDNLISKNIWIFLWEKYKKTCYCFHDTYICLAVYEIQLSLTDRLTHSKISKTTTLLGTGCGLPCAGLEHLRLLVGSQPPLYSFLQVVSPVMGMMVKIGSTKYDTACFAVLQNNLKRDFWSEPFSANFYEHL